MVQAIRRLARGPGWYLSTLSMQERTQSDLPPWVRVLASWERLADGIPDYVPVQAHFIPGQVDVVSPTFSQSMRNVGEVKRRQPSWRIACRDSHKDLTRVKEKS